MNNVEDIGSYRFQKQDRLFFDANVWLNVYGPIVTRGRQSRIYSKALYNIRQVCCALFIDVPVLWEFVSVFARVEHKQSAHKDLAFKKFRESPEFKLVAKDIAQSARRIIKQCDCCESVFTMQDVEKLLNEYEQGESDFNDQLITKICLMEGLKLVTDDKDFKSKGLNILTANPFLLSH
ncbi:MAG: PIN domain-containing protein [Candidatus Helarchaeota archaeon]|nr:PIN domain-containing protein [Candidatus Helarchaeota archaeon]